MRFSRKNITALAGLTAAVAVAQAASAENLVIGTSSPGGSYFLMGGGLSTAITRDVKGITLSTRTTAGSTTNLRMLGQKGSGIDLGLANLGAVYNAVTATGKFKGKKPITNVRALMALTISPIHWVTLAKDNITSFADLKGKRVSLAKAGSGTAANADLVLRTVGVRDQVKAQFLGFSEAGNALRDGNIDAFAVSSAVPVPVVTAMSATRKVRLIPLSPSELKAVMTKNPAFAPYTIKASDYGSGVVADAQSYGVPSTIVTRADVPADVIYRIVKYVYSEKTNKYMKTVYKSWHPTPSLSLFKNAGVKMHPGALRAYKELGMM
ncbi:MAG: TAXI family TRAP transporter solute-binding subunit [Proteobacteria bacterium]|nr:TAXI family TRAP transporter solute-binding subunit [Pseudomonadota bacterium]MDA1357940.1 TAXI family TRAP transporter solute-binding subunit [Pseudomonadota bacterium]